MADAHVGVFDAAVVFGIDDNDVLGEFAPNGRACCRPRRLCRAISHGPFDGPTTLGELPLTLMTNTTSPGRAKLANCRTKRSS